jgi:hypothetical protein
MSYGRGMGQDCSNSSSACSWYDDIWATQGCLDWYAACDPTNAFYVLNTKGLIVGGSSVLGTTAANALAAGTNSFFGLNTGTIPGWAVFAGLALGAFLIVPPILKAVR